MKAAGEINGQTFDVSNQMKKHIEEAGFVNIVDQSWQDPLGGWAADPKLRELGRWTMLGFEIGLEGYALAMLTRYMNVSLLSSFKQASRPKQATDILQWSVAEVQVLL